MFFVRFRRTIKTTLDSVESSPREEDRSFFVPVFEKWCFELLPMRGTAMRKGHCLVCGVRAGGGAVGENSRWIVCLFSVYADAFGP